MHLKDKAPKNKNRDIDQNECRGARLPTRSVMTKGAEVKKETDSLWTKVLEVDRHSLHQEG